MQFMTSHIIFQDLRHMNINICLLSAAGWVLFGFGVIQFPIWALIAVIKRKEVSNDLE
jgi:hypothetical protein